MRPALDNQQWLMSLPREKKLLTTARCAKIVRITKILSFTLFTIYAATKSEGVYIKEHMSPDLLQEAWGDKFLFMGKYAYGLTAGLVFYALMLRKQEGSGERSH